MSGAWAKGKPKPKPYAHLRPEGHRNLAADPITVFAPPVEGARVTVAAFLKVVLRALGRDAVHMARVESGCIVVALVSQAAVDTLLGEGVTVDGHHFHFFRGERRGSSVRLYGLPWSATYDRVHAALTAQLGEVNSLTLRTHPGTTVLTGEALAFVRMDASSTPTSVSMADRKVRCKIVHATTESTAPDKPVDKPAPEYEDADEATASAYSSPAPLPPLAPYAPTSAAPAAATSAPAAASAQATLRASSSAKPTSARAGATAGERGKTKVAQGLQGGFLLQEKPTRERSPPDETRKKAKPGGEDTDNMEA